MNEIPLITKEKRERAKHLKKSLRLSEIIETRGVYYDNHPTE